MTVHTAERRRSMRLIAAYPVTINDRGGKILARGRTANICEHGIFLVAHDRFRFIEGGEVVVRLTIPDTSSGRCSRPDASRTVVYVCRVARKQSLGPLTGVGLEFLRKLA